MDNVVRLERGTNDTQTATSAFRPTPQKQQQQNPNGRKIRHPRRLLILQWIVGIFCSFSAMASFHNVGTTSKSHTLASLPSPLRTSLASDPATSPTTSSSKTPRFAYAFLISGCDPSAPLTYRPYLWNILVAAKNLRQSSPPMNSNTTTHHRPTDIVVMVQFQRNTTTKTLPSSDVQWLELYDSIHIHYLPPLLKDNFYTAQFAKFHILELTQYDRVLYMDADVMPLCSLDYIFDLTMTSSNVQDNIDPQKPHSHKHTNRIQPTPLLQPNVVLAWFTEPAHGGWFLLQPFPGAYQQLQDVVHRRDQEAMTLPYPHWDPIQGWGARLNEEWRGIGGSPSLSGGGGGSGSGANGEGVGQDGTRTFAPPRHSSNWTFHGDFADQGLLYFWTRFHQKAVSILYLDSILDYVGDTQTHRTEPDVINELRRNTCLPAHQEEVGHYGSTLNAPLFYGKVPHRDFIHFSGTQKPWETKRTTFWPSTSTTHSIESIPSSTDYWYVQLGDVWKDFATKYPNRTLPTLPLKFKMPPLGRYPTHRSMIRTIQKKFLKEQQKQQEQQKQHVLEGK